MIEIDGSQGEGGGQMLRTSLTLSACLGLPVTIRQIRAKRSNPGLRAQHIAAVRAIAQVCRVEAEELSLGQTDLTFHPQAVRPGAFSLDVGTAGSTCLILQTMILPLAMAKGPSIVKVTGGTHNPKAPFFEYLAHVWLPFLRQIGLKVGIGMGQAGFYPHGGGTVVAQIDGHAVPERLIPLDLTERGAPTSLSGTVKIANQPMQVGYRLREALFWQMRRREIGPIEIEIELIEAKDQAGYCALFAEFEKTRTASAGVTSKGNSPEGAAADTMEGLADFLSEEKGGQTALDPHAADQVMVPLALVPKTSRYTTSRVTKHCLTNAAVIQQMTNRSVTVEGKEGQPGLITIT